MLITPALILLGLNAWLLWHISRAKLGVHRLYILPFWLAAAYEILTVFPATFVAWLRRSTLLFADYGPPVIIDTDALPMLVWASAFLAMMLGYIASGGSSRNQALRLRRFLDAPRVDQPSPKAVALACLAMVALLGAGGLYYYQGLPPIVSAVDFDESLAEVADTMRAERKAISKGHYFGAEYRGQGIVLSLMAIGFPWLGALAMTNAGRRRLGWGLAAVAIVVLGFLFLAGGGVRSRFVEMLLILFIAVTARRRVSLRRVATLGLVVLAVAVPMSLLTGKVTSAGSAVATTAVSLEKIGYRIMFGNGSNNLPVIELVRREVLPLGYGRLHFDKVINAVPGIERAPFAQELAELLTYREGVTTFASMTGLGFGFAEAGITGSVLLYFLAGAIIGLTERWLFTLRKNPLNLATIAVVTLLAGKLTFLNAVSFLVNFAVCAGIAVAALSVASLVDWFSVRRRVAPRGQPADARSSA